MAAARVTPAEREKMWELYNKYGTYVAVAKKLHRSPDTVSRHVREYKAAVEAAGAVLKAKEV